MLKTLYSLDNLYDSFKDCKKRVSWKHSIQEFEKDLLLNIKSIQDDIWNRTYIEKPPHEFMLKERGKARLIKAMHIRDRVVQKVLCNYLLSIIEPKLIYDNGASITNKGISFTRKRFEKHLHDYYNKYKTNVGYILQYDFSKYFDNIDHKTLKELFREIIRDDGIMWLINIIIDNFTIYADRDYGDRPIDVKDYKRGKVPNHRSVGIGAQFSQIVGIFYPHKIDNYFKIVKGIKGYGRYMDDGYIICHTKEEAHELYERLKEQCAKYKIFLNLKKTRINRLDKIIVFLKIRYNLTSSGHLVRRINKEISTRYSRKLSKFKNKIDIDDEYIENLHKSFMGEYRKYDSYKTLRRIINKYKETIYVRERAKRIRAESSKNQRT